MLKAIRKYFSPEASAQRQRNDERRVLAAELRGLPRGVYGDAREGFIKNRVIELDKLDLAAALQASGVPERRKAYRLVEPAPAYVEADEVARQKVREMSRFGMVGR